MSALSSRLTAEPAVDVNGYPLTPRTAASKELMEMRLQFDLVNTESRAVQHKLNTIRNRSTSFVKAEDLSAAADDDAAEIAGLEAELNHVAVRAYETWEQRKTYEQVVKRLKEESTTYTQELQKIDLTTGAKEHDYHTLQLMLKDASHVRDVARHDLTKVEASVAAERKERTRVLQEKRRKLKQKQEAAQAHQRRSEARRDAIEREKTAAMARREVTVTASELASEREQIAAFEAQFAQIKEVAGADGVNEVIEKFTAQEETHATLVALSRESQSRIDALISQRAEAKKALEVARYVGAPLTEAALAPSPEAAVNGVDERERQHEELQLQQQRERQRVGRLHKVSALIVEARVAIEHLSNIVSTTAQLPGSPRAAGLEPTAGPTAGEGEVSDAVLAEQLRTATQQLDALFDEVKGSRGGRSPLAMERQLPRPASADAIAAPADEGPPEGPQDEAANEAEARVLDRAAALEALTMDEGDDSALPIFKQTLDNVRIVASYGDDDDDDDDEEEDPDNPTDPVMDRETLKKNARLLLKKQTKTGKRGRSRKGGHDDDDGPRPSSPTRPTTGDD